MSDDAGVKMSFLEHLEELRKRFIFCAVALLAGIIICWFFRDQIMSFLLFPLYKAWSEVEGLPELKPLNFSSMLEPFVAYMKLSAVGGLFLSAPVILHQLWKFIAPGLYRRERRLALPFVLVSSVLFVGGSVMAYSVIFPIGFRFFLEFAAGREMTTLEAKIAVSGLEPDGSKPRNDIRPENSRTVASGKDISTKTGDVNRSAEPNSSDRAGAGQGGAPKGAGGSWYDGLLGHIGRKDCAVLSASRATGDRAAAVSFQWHTASCGDPPDLHGLKRDGLQADLSWQRSQHSQAEYVIFNAVDADLSAGEHIYTFKVPADPNAHRLAPMLMITDYLSLAIQLLLAFGLIFELPVLISFLSFAGIVNYRQLLRFSRWFIVIAVVVGAILTPPDVLSQILLAVPLIALYFVSVLIAYLFGPKPID